MTSFGPACWPSSGHYARARKRTHTLCNLRLDITPCTLKNIINVYTVYKGAVELHEAQGYLKNCVNVGKI